MTEWEEGNGGSDLANNMSMEGGPIVSWTYGGFSLSFNLLAPEFGI